MATKPKTERQKASESFWLGLFGLAVGLVCLGALAWNGMRYWKVKTEGVETTGVITEASSGRTPRVFYRYEVEGRRYTGHSYVGYEMYEKAKSNIGGEIPIVYYPDYPKFSAIRGFNRKAILPLLVIAIALFVPSGVYLLAEGIRGEWKYHRSLRVADN